MIDIEESFRSIPMRIAIGFLLSRRDLTLSEVGELLGIYCVNEFPPILRVYLDGYPDTRKRGATGRPYRISTDAALIRDYELLLCYFELLYHNSTTTGSKLLRNQIAEHIKLRLCLHVDPPAIFNKLSRIRYNADTLFFWFYVADNCGVEKCIALLEFINPDRQRIKREVKLRQKLVEQIDDIIVEHNINK